MKKHLSSDYGMSAFNEVREQINWAETRIEAARIEIARYIGTEAFRFVQDVDTKTGEQVRKIVLVKDVPMSIKGQLRNAVVDLKHAFDMSLHAAATSFRVCRFDKNFPWAETPSGVRAKIASWQRDHKSCLPDPIIDEIWRQEPYGTGQGYSGGEDLTREVAKMANNKHSIGIGATAQIQTVSFTNIEVINAQSFTLMEAWNPKKKELVLSRHIGLVRYDDPAVTGNVVFERVGRLGPLPAVPTAMAFLERAKLCVDGFESLVHSR